MSTIKRSVTVTVLSAALVVTASSARAQSGSEWPMYGGDYANTRYSTLNQINTANVNRLRVGWMRSLGTLESQEATPIVVGDTMYVSTSTASRWITRTFFRPRSCTLFSKLPTPGLWTSTPR